MPPSSQSSAGTGGQGWSGPDALRGLLVPIADLHPDPANARRHGERNLEAIVGSLDRFGQRFPLVVQRQGMVVRAGNGRLEAMRRMGWTHAAAVVVDESSVEATAFAIADNRTAELAEWDDEALAGLLQSLPEADRLVAGFNDDDLREVMNRLTPEVVAPTKKLADRFLFPPFTVLDARQGVWQDRKREWLSIGIESELGRGGAPGGSPRPAARLTASGRTQRGDGKGAALR